MGGLGTTDREARYLNVYLYLQISTNIYNYLRASTTSYEHLRASANIYQYLGTYADKYRYLAGGHQLPFVLEQLLVLRPQRRDRAGASL